MKILVSSLRNRCGYPAVNASFYDLSFHPISSNKDCRLYKNSKAIKCYNCDSCKYASLNFVSYISLSANRFLHLTAFFACYKQPRAGVAQYMKIEWRVVAIFNVILFVVLVQHLYYLYNPKIVSIISLIRCWIVLNWTDIFVFQRVVACIIPR